MRIFQRRNAGFLLAVVCLLFALSGTAQDTFNSEKELRNKASRFYNNDDFAECLPMYSQLLSLYPKDPEYNYRYGVCLLMAGKEKEKSILYLASASKSPETEKEVFYYLGRAYHLNYRFDDAINTYNNYKAKAGDKKALKYDVDRQIEMCKNGKALLQNITDLTVIQKNQFPVSDYFRAYDLGNSGIKIIIKPDDLKSPIDKKRNETSIIVINPGSPFIYFSSYGNEDKGQKDLYRIQSTDNFSWSRAQSLGSKINTPFDEDYPFISSDGKSLIFSSKGHNSMGGYDVFRCVFDSLSSAFGEPINLDFAINTPDDDMLYITDSKLEYAYFASRRNTDASNISVFKIRKERVPGKVVLVRGNFFSGKEDNHPAARIILKNENGSRTLSTITPNKSGFYQVVLRQGLAYTYTVESEGFAPQTKTINIPEISDSRPLLQEVNLQKNNGTDELSINSHLQEGPPDESTLQAIAAFLKEKAGLEVNVGQQINEGLISAAKPVAARKTEKPKDANKELLEAAQKDAKESEKEAMELKAQYAELSALAAQNNDSANLFQSKFDNTKKQQFKKQAELYQIKAKEFNAQARDAEVRYNEKKTEADWQAGYAAQMETAINAGDNQAIAKLKTTSYDKQKTVAAKTETPKQPEAKAGSAESLAQQIEQLKKDQAGLTDPAARETVQKQIDQLTQDLSQKTGQPVAQETPSASKETPRAEGDAYAQVAASDKVLSDAAALRKRAAKTTDPAAKVRMLKEADNQTRKGQEAKIGAESRLIQSQEAEIKQKQTDISQLSVGTDDALLGKLTQENNALMADAQNLMQQAAKDPSAAGKSRKLESARMLNEKIMANQKRVLESQSASREQQEQAAKAKLAQADAAVKEAENAEQKASEALAAASTIKESREKDITMANNLISYANGVKKESKKKDAQNAAAAYERDAARKKQSLDSLQQIADGYKARAAEWRGQSEQLRKEAQNPSAALAAAPANATTGNSNESNATAALPDPEFLKYSSLKEEQTKQNNSYEQAKKQAAILRVSGKNKLDRVMQVLEEAQVSGNKKDRNAALRESLQLDKEGNTEIAQADSLDKILPSLKEKADAANQTFETLNASLPAAKAEAYKKQMEQAVQVTAARNAAPAAGNVEVNGNKFQNYVPGQTVDGLSYSADELKNILSSPEFNTYYNLRQEGDSANFFYDLLATKSQSISDTVKILAAEAADLMEQSDDASGAAAKSYKDRAKLKETLADKLLAKADSLFNESKPLSELVDKKDKETLRLIEKLDNRTASDYKVIYEKIARKEFFTNSALVARYMPRYSEANRPAAAKTGAEQSAAVQPKPAEATPAPVNNEEPVAAKEQAVRPKEQTPANTNEAATAQNASTGNERNRRTEAPVRNNTQEPAGGEILYDAPPAQGLIFRVQVGAYNRRVARNPFGDRYPLFGRQVNNFVVYDAGAFLTPAEANTARDYFRQNGLNDAFVTAYCNGTRISVRQALAYIRLGTDCNNQPVPDAQLAANAGNNALKTVPPSTEQSNLKQFTELLYTVQVGVYRTLIPAAKLYNLSPLYYDTIARRLIRYSVGIYDNAGAANEAKNQIVGVGIRDAFVIPYFNKRRISVQEAERIARERGQSAFVKGALVNAKPASGNTGIQQNAAQEGAGATADISAEERNSLKIKVQIGVFRKDVPVETMNVFLKLANKGIDIVKSADGLSTYTIGNFSSLNEAEALRNEALAAGLADAFLVGYAGNKKISIERVKAILQTR